MRRSTSGQRRKVEEARAVVQQALGDKARKDAPQVPTEPVQVKDLVLTIGEVAVRLDISRAEVERMIAAGKMRALKAGWTVVVRSNEVERIQSERI